MKACVDCRLLNLTYMKEDIYIYIYIYISDILFLVSFIFIFNSFSFLKNKIEIELGEMRYCKIKNYQNREWSTKLILVNYKD